MAAVITIFLHCLGIVDGGGRQAVSKEQSSNESCTFNSATARRSITIDDYDCIKDLSEVKISEDGRYVAYVVQSVLRIQDTETGADWTPLDTEDKSSWSPVWSGHTLYFFASADDNHREIWEASADGRNRKPAVKIGCLQFGVKALNTDVLNISNDGTRVLLELESALVTEKTEVDNPVVGGGDEKCTLIGPAEAPEPTIITGMVFKEEDVGYVDKKKHVYLVRLATGNITELTRNSTMKGSASHDTDAAWSADGGQVAFIREYPSKLQFSSELWMTSSRVPNAAVRLSSGLAQRRSPAWSNDGQFIAYIYAETQSGPYATERLAIYSTRDRSERILTANLDRTVISFAFSPNGGYIYFIYASGGGQYLARVRVTGGKIETLIRGNRLISAIDASKNDKIALIMNNFNDFPDVYVNHNKNSIRLTRLNDDLVKHLKIGRKEKFWISYQGSRYEAFITLPPNFNPSRRYPAVLNIHGGPIDDQHTYGFKFFSQVLASNGLVVVEPNGPGSLGRGQRSNLQIYRNWGCTKRPPILLAVDHLIESKLIDSRRLGVTGYSYGGYMTNCLITQVPMKFKVAASGGGHSFVAANYGHDQWLKWYAWELGKPWENRSLFDKISPLMGASRVITPTLFLGGAADWTAPILNSELLHQALTMNNVETQLVIYQGGHNGWGTDLDKDYYRRIVEWLVKHLDKNSSHSSMQ